MSEPTPPRSGKAAAAAAAKTLLADRIALVNTLGDALDVHRKQDAAATHARDAATKQPKRRAPPTPAR